MINASEADWFHGDTMDGVFVPNISYRSPVLEAINKRETIDVHLMMVDPGSLHSQNFAETRANSKCTLWGLHAPPQNTTGHKK
jgi:pentose-5-phosphate-3-epimerase